MASLKKHRKLLTTGKVVTAAGVGLLIYEGIVLANKEEGDTISEFFWSLMRRPIVPFALGGLTMHFVWQSQDVYDSYAEKALDEKRKRTRRREDQIREGL